MSLIRSASCICACIYIRWACFSSHRTKHLTPDQGAEAAAFWARFRIKQKKAPPQKNHLWHIKSFLRDKSKAAVVPPYTHGRSPAPKEMLSLIQAWNALWELQTLVKRLTSTAAVVPARLFSLSLSSTTSSYLEGRGRLFSSPANVFLHRHANKGGARFWFWFFQSQVFNLPSAIAFAFVYSLENSKGDKTGREEKESFKWMHVVWVITRRLAANTQVLSLVVLTSQFPTALSHLRSDWNWASLNLIKRMRDGRFGPE